MRRYLFVLLFVVVLLTPILWRKLIGSRQSAPAGNELRLVILTPHVEGIRREFADAFSAWHREKFGQPVFVDYRNFGGGSDIVKYFEEVSRSAQHSFQIDLVWGGGDYLFDQQLKKPGYLQPVNLDPQLISQAFPRPDLGGVALYDRQQPPAWFGTALSSFGIVYNKDVCRYLGVPEPRTWTDLADPRLRGWVVLADPTRSASTRMTFMAIVERAMADAAQSGRSEDAGWADGMGLIRLISANARMFTDSASTVPGLVGSGEAAAGMAIDFYGRSQVDAVGDARLGYVEPAGATVINPDPIALVKGAEHRDVAIRFIEFVLSPPGQKLWNTRATAPGGPRVTSLRRLPIRPDTYADMANFTDPVNPYALAGGFNKSDAREGTFGILGELIQISCMDLLDELRQTRAAIAASPQREELEAQLAVFPFDQQEALRRAAMWKKAPPVQRLALQRQWREEFRSEYRRLRQAATGPS